MLSREAEESLVMICNIVVVLGRLMPWPIDAARNLLKTVLLLEIQ
jgi:hypothetical protein